MKKEMTKLLLEYGIISSEEAEKIEDLTKQKTLPGKKLKKIWIQKF